MKTSGGNKLPLWARYFGILIGFPLIVGSLRAVLEHWFSRLIADLSVLVALMIVSLLFFWKRKKHTHQMPDAPMTREERQHDRHEVQKLWCVIFAMFAIVLLTGTFFGFCIMFGATPEGYPVVLWCVFRLFGAGIGIVCLLLTFVCFEQAKFEFLLLKGRKSSSKVSVSYNATLCALVIVLAIAFAITKLCHL